jgi:4-hydroxy-2-oxoheptanedioate aldolase
LTSLLGFDGIWLDMEHHAVSMETAMNLMRAARVGSSDIMARPAKGEFMRMSRMLECGAQGILYPRCDNAAEAREVVRWAKFAPIGQRGFDGGNPDTPYCAIPIPDYIKMANEQTFVAIQIEDPKALDHVEEIAAVEGVDVIFLGPADFTVLSGVPGQFDHAVVHDACRRISAAVKKAGKHWGMPTWSPEHAQQMVDLGARFLAHGSDIMFVKRALEDLQRRFGPVGFQFENRLS